MSQSNILGYIGRKLRSTLYKLRFVDWSVRSIASFPSCVFAILRMGVGFLYDSFLRQVDRFGTSIFCSRFIQFSCLNYSTNVSIADCRSTYLELRKLESKMFLLCGSKSVLRVWSWQSSN